MEIRHAREPVWAGGTTRRVDARHAIDGKCYNYYTKNDGILSYLYQAANLLQSTPIGLSRLPTSDFTKDKLFSIDCSEQVKGHSGYHAALRYILKTERKKSFWQRLWVRLFSST